MRSCAGTTMDAFKPGNMRKLEGWIHGHARDLIGEMAGLGSGDFVDLVAGPTPGRIFASFFGLHAEDQQATIRAAQDLLSWNDPYVCAVFEPLEHFVNCVMDAAPDRRRARGGAPRHADRRPDDVARAGGVGGRADGRRRDRRVLLVLLAVAANDTSRHASAGAIHLLTKFEDQRRLLLEDIPGRVEGAVEEVVRWVTPVIHMRRTAFDGLRDPRPADQGRREGRALVLLR